MENTDMDKYMKILSRPQYFPNLIIRLGIKESQFYLTLLISFWRLICSVSNPYILKFYSNYFS